MSVLGDSSSVGSVEIFGLDNLPADEKAIYRLVANVEGTSGQIMLVAGLLSDQHGLDPIEHKDNNVYMSGEAPVNLRGDL